MTSLVPQLIISKSCETDLEQHGDSVRGVGYNQPAQATERYGLMLNVVKEKDRPVSVLDLGCGLGHLFDHLQSDEAYRNFVYTGLDISEKYLEVARRRRPQATFLLMDVLKGDTALGVFDYVILNGLFNYRGEIPPHDMLDYWQRLTSIAFRHCRRGMAFNVMSKIVDWERDDLFHLPFDTMARHVATLSRYFVVRHDYRAYEYTTYIYREPNAS